MHFFKYSTVCARVAASELTMLTWGGSAQHVVRSNCSLSSVALIAGILAGSSGERKSSTPSKPHSLMRANSGSCCFPTWVVQTIVFTPNFMSIIPFFS